MPKFVKPGETEPEVEPNKQQTTVSDVSDLPKVKVGDEMLPFTEAVDVMGKMVGSPEAFGMVSEKQYIDLRNELHETRNAVAELARAVESLGQGQAVLSDYDIEATVQLDDEALGEIYDATVFDLGDN